MDWVRRVRGAGPRRCGGAAVSNGACGIAPRCALLRLQPLPSPRTAGKVCGDSAPASLPCTWLPGPHASVSRFLLPCLALAASVPATLWLLQHPPSTMRAFLRANPLHAPLPPLPPGRIQTLLRQQARGRGVLGGAPKAVRARPERVGILLELRQCPLHTGDIVVLLHRPKITLRRLREVAAARGKPPKPARDLCPWAKRRGLHLFDAFISHTCPTRSLDCCNSEFQSAVAMFATQCSGQLEIDLSYMHSHFMYAVAYAAAVEGAQFFREFPRMQLRPLQAKPRAPYHLAGIQTHIHTNLCHCHNNSPRHALQNLPSPRPLTSQAAPAIA